MFIKGDSLIGIIEIDSIIGIIDTVIENRREYSLEDLPAGGRFIIWENMIPQRAEYTVYGSGLPIVWSERGTLEEVQ